MKNGHYQKWLTVTNIGLQSLLEGANKIAESSTTMESLEFVAATGVEGNDEVVANQCLVVHLEIVTVGKVIWAILQLWGLPKDKAS